MGGERELTPPGRGSPLPWEGVSEGAQRRVKRLGRLKRPLLRCLSRDPAERLTAAELEAAFNDLFKTRTVLAPQPP